MTLGIAAAATAMAAFMQFGSLGMAPLQPLAELLGD